MKKFWVVVAAGQFLDTVIVNHNWPWLDRKLRRLWDGKKEDRSDNAFSLGFGTPPSPGLWVWEGIRLSELDILDGRYRRPKPGELDILVPMQLQK